MLSTDLPRMPGIYKIYFLDPNLFYIGSSINLQKRYHLHKVALRQGKHGNSHLQRAWNKYGEDAFHFEILEPVERKEDVIEREQYYIDTLKPYYNIHKMARSALGIKRSPEHCAKNGAAHRGKPSPKKGIPVPEKERQRLQALTIGVPSWNKGIPMREESKQKMIAGKKGKPNPHPGYRGPHKFTPESSALRDAKIRAARAAKTPEQLAEAVEKRKATMAAKRAAREAEQLAKASERLQAMGDTKVIIEGTFKQAPLWDDESVS